MPSSLYSHSFLSDTFSDTFVKFRVIPCNHLQKIPCYSIQVSKVSCKLLKWNYFFQDYHFSFIFHYWLFLLPLRFKCQSAVKFSTKKMVLSELQTCPAIFFHIHLLVIQLPLIPHKIQISIHWANWFYRIFFYLSKWCNHPISFRKSGKNAHSSSLSQAHDTLANY